MGLLLLSIVATLPEGWSAKRHSALVTSAGGVFPAKVVWKGAPRSPVQRIWSGPASGSMEGAVLEVTVTWSEVTGQEA